MERKSPKLLEDIRDAAAFVRQILENKTLDDYRRDRLLRQAVERNFEIVGEAVGRLAMVDPDTSSRIGQYAQIIAFRNLLIHGYDLIDDAQVWEVIRLNLPTLEAEVTVMLAESGQE
ncbi:MAG: HepT-like ribonuclease domain-containing protein [Pirellulales bacterium]